MTTLTATRDDFVTAAALAASDVTGLPVDHPAVVFAVKRGAARLEALAAAARPTPYTVRRKVPGVWLVRRDGRTEGPHLGAHQPSQRAAVAFACYLALSAAHGPSALVDDARAEYLALYTADSRSR